MMHKSEQKALRPQQQTEAEMIKTIKEQVEVLAAWNKENINDNPEQVRKNTETIFSVATYLISYQLHTAPDQLPE